MRLKHHVETVSNEWSERSLNRKQSALKGKIMPLIPELRRFARILTSCEVEADKVVRMACHDALSRQAQWDRSQPLDRWLFRVLRSCWLSEHRLQKDNADDAQREDATKTDRDGLTANEKQFADRHAYGAVSDLPVELAAVVLMVSVKGYSYAEAAAFFRVPTKTIMTRMCQARQMLVAQMREDRIPA